MIEIPIWLVAAVAVVAPAAYALYCIGFGWPRR